MKLHLLEPTLAAARTDAFLSQLDENARDNFAAAAQTAASTHGLMRGPDEIPLVLSPVALPREELRQLGHAARLLVSALVKVSRDLLINKAERASLLYQHLSPIELAALKNLSREGEELLVARVDWFIDRGDGRRPGSGQVRALEVNATIPAMQVYSDAAVAGWLHAFLPADKAAALIAKSPSNASWLLDTFLGAAEAAGRGDPAQKFPRGLEMQLLHRSGDPQATELQNLALLARARGVDAKTVTPETINLDGDTKRALYRHLFARYVDKDSALGKAMLEPRKHAMWNRVNGWLETKGLVGELSLHVDQSYASGKSALLTNEELANARTLLPWTRILDDATAGELGDGDKIVLKRSHDYGGKSVCIGRDAGPEGFAQAVAEARKEKPGTWVAQGLVDAASSERWLATRDEMGCRAAKRIPLHLDISTYASLLPGAKEGGSVCRAAPGRIVNIVGGGGVAPLFTEEVLAEALLMRE